jgi:hypothetical protein
MNQDRLIHAAMFALLTLALVAFFFDPKYKDGVWAGILAFSNVLSYCTGSKSALSTPDAQKLPEGSSVSEKTTEKTVEKLP